MIKTFASRFVVIACVCAFAFAALTGCMQQTSAANDEQAANRQYMADVNQKIDVLGERLEDFNDAVARGDVVAMRTHANAAFEAIDEIAALEAPDALAELETGYVEGCTLLKDALNSYIELYAEVESSSADKPFDRSKYEKRLEDIQSTYDAGIALLEETDLKASQM